MVKQTTPQDGCRIQANPFFSSGFSPIFIQCLPRISGRMGGKQHTFQVHVWDARYQNSCDTKCDGKEPWLPFWSFLVPLKVIFLPLSVVFLQIRRPFRPIKGLVAFPQRKVSSTTQTIIATWVCLNFSISIILLRASYPSDIWKDGSARLTNHSNSGNRFSRPTVAVLRPNIILVDFWTTSKLNLSGLSFKLEHCAGALA